MVIRLEDDNTTVTYDNSLEEDEDFSDEEWDD